MILEGEDAVRFHEYLNRKPTQEEINFCKKVLETMEKEKCPCCGEYRFTTPKKFDPPI